MKCHEIETLLAAYALDALGAEERFAVESHVDGCPSCRRALADYQAVADGLAFAAPPVEPPPALRARLLTQVAAPAPRRNRFERLRGLWSQLNPLVALAAFVLLLISNVVLGYQIHRLAQTQQVMARRYQASQDALALMANPDARTTVLKGEGVQGTLIYDPQGRTAVLTVQGLERLPAGKDYQLWLIQPDETRLSGGVFDAEEAGVTLFVIHSPHPMDAFAGVGVTIEPAGGSPGPTGQRVFGGKF